MSDLTRRVDNYLRTNARRLDDELAYFRRLRLQFAVEEAAKAIGPDGKMLSHQHRVGGDSCGDAAKRLLECLSEIEKCKGFDELLTLVRQATQPVTRFGDHAQYDTTLRIAAKLTTPEAILMPKVVYLHAGTREGARQLGFDTTQEFLTMQEIEQHHPELLRLKEPYHIENFLCCSLHD